MQAAIPDSKNFLIITPQITVKHDDLDQILSVTRKPFKRSAFLLRAEAILLTNS